MKSSFRTAEGLPGLEESTAKSGPAGLGTALLHSVHRHIQAATARGAETHCVGPFVLHLRRSPDPFYRNVAIPRRPGLGIARSDLRKLRHSFAGHRRTCRIEAVAELHPGFEDLLQCCGFRIERRPLLISFAAPERPTGIRPVERLSPERARDLLTSLHRQFGSPPPSAMEATVLREGIERGHYRACLFERSGDILSAGFLVVAEGAAELVGLFTAPRWRRNGLASCITATLLRDFLPAGGEFVWLACEPAAIRLYRRLGFVEVGTRIEAFAPERSCGSA